MKIGIMFANVVLFGSPEGATAMATAAEEAGIESLWTVEHVVLPAGFESAYPYSDDGKLPGGEDVPIPDPIVWLTWAAAHSSTVRLCTGILILPQRNPVVLSKQISTLDTLSGGRVSLGVGVGWLREEFEAIGVPFEGRGQRTDDAIGALRSLWTEAEPTFSSETVSFTKAKMNPKPPQGSVPIVIGGHTEAAARRAGRIGDGFFPAAPEHLPKLLPTMRAAAEEAGRDPDSVEVMTGGLPTAEAVEKAAALGATRYVIPPPTFLPDELPDALRNVMQELT